MMMGSLVPRQPAPQPVATNLRRRSILQTVSLPVEARRVLKAIVADMRNLPRDCICDRAELLHWLRRMANRIEGVERLQVQVGPAVPRWTARPQPRPLTAISPRAAAEMAFKSSEPATGPRLAPRRMIRSRKGRVVQVETKQLNLWGNL